MEESVYKDQFKSWDDVVREFAIDDDPKPTAVLLAGYYTGDYEGDAVVIYRKEDKYYYAEGSHCSCYGLEGQFEPTEYENTAVLLEALKMMTHYNAQEDIDRVIERLES